MSSGLAITKAALDEFEMTQEYMLLAKEENAAKTYSRMLKRYHHLKALLNLSGVSLTAIDIIKE